MKGGVFKRNSIPRHVWDVLASGARMNAKQVTQAVGDRRADLDGWSTYANVAQALSTFAKAGRLQREKVRGKFVYWRTDVVPDEAAS